LIKSTKVVAKATVFYSVNERSLITKIMTQKLFSFVAIIFALITDSRKEMPSQFSTNRMGLLTKLIIALHNMLLVKYFLHNFSFGF
jgi:hypothetical protein